MIGSMGRTGARFARVGARMAALGGLLLAPVASAQIRTVDPNTAIDSDLAPPPVQNSTPTDPGVDTSLPPPASSTDSGAYNAAPAAGGATATGAPVTSNSPPAAMAPGESYQEDDLIGAAEGVFGKGAEGLAALVRETMGADPFSGAVYVFRAKRADRVKLVYFDGTGVCLLAKRLEDGKFCWPAITDGVVRLSAAQLQALLEGLDWRRVHDARETRAPVAAS